MSEFVNGEHIQYLALGVGETENGEICMISARLEPENNDWVHNLLLTEEEAIRLRDDLNRNFPENKHPAKNRLFPEGCFELDR